MIVDATFLLLKYCSIFYLGVCITVSIILSIESIADYGVKLCIDCCLSMLQLCMQFGILIYGITCCDLSKKLFLFKCLCPQLLVFASANRKVLFVCVELDIFILKIYNYCVWRKLWSTWKTDKPKTWEKEIFIASVRDSLCLQQCSMMLSCTSHVNCKAARHN